MSKMSKINVNIKMSMDLFYCHVKNNPSNNTVQLESYFLVHFNIAHTNQKSIRVAKVKSNE